MKNNWLKMYDKFGLVARIETVIPTIPESFVFGDGESVKAAARWRGAR